MTRVARGLALLTIALLAAACGRGGDSQHRLVISGSSTVAPLVAEIAARFERAHPGVRVEVQTGGSARGVADLRRSAADIAMLSRELDPGSEADLVSTSIALDAIALIVHADNPVRALTDDQLAAIFTGQTTRWSEVGGTDDPITVVNKAEGRATLDLFLRHFRLNSRDIRASVVIGDNQHGIRTVAGDPRAIGYVSIGTAELEISRGVLIRMLPLGGVHPSRENVNSGAFPLVRPLLLVARNDPPELAQKFLTFASSEDVRDLVLAQRFVPPTD